MWHTAAFASMARCASSHFHPKPHVLTPFVCPNSFTFGSNFLRAVGGPVTAFGAVAIGAGNAYVDYAVGQEADNNAVINAIYDERLAGRMVNSANTTISDVRQKMTDEKCK